MRKGIKIPGTLKAFLPSLFSPGAFQLQMLPEQGEGCLQWLGMGTPSPKPKPACQPRRPSSCPHSSCPHLVLVLLPTRLFSVTFLLTLTPQPLSAPFWTSQEFSTHLSSCCFLPPIHFLHCCPHPSLQNPFRSSLWRKYLTGISNSLPSLQDGHMPQACLSLPHPC